MAGSTAKGKLGLISTSGPVKAVKRVMYVQYANPAMYPPLEHSSRILANDGWEVLFLGINATADIHFPPHPNITVRRWKYRRPGIVQKLQYIAFNGWVVAAALRWRPDWVYASEFFASPAALVLAIIGFHVVYHEHDHPGSARGAFDAWLYWTRRVAARNVELVVVPNDGRLRCLRRETGRTREMVSIWNTPARTEAEVRPEKATNAFIVLYHGSIVPARIPLTVIQALPLLPQELRLCIVGYETIGHLGYSAKITRLADTLGVADRVRLLGTVPSRDELLSVTRCAHVGLALMPLAEGDLNMRDMVGASNKPFEYLACGCALLVTDLPQWRERFVDTDLGRACDPEDPNSIAEALRWFVEHPAQMRRMGEQGRERVLREWNYERQFGFMRERLLRAVHA